MTRSERLAFLQIALGKASVLFMSQRGGGEIVMPTEGLSEIVDEISAVYESEIEKLKTLIRQYIDEWDTPVPDLTLRWNYRNQLRRAVGRKGK